MAVIFQTTFSNAFSWMKIHKFRSRFSLKFVPNGLINNIPALVEKMAWRRPGGKPFPEPMMVSLLTHICVIRPQWSLKSCSGLTGGECTRISPSYVCQNLPFLHVETLPIWMLDHPWIKHVEYINLLNSINKSAHCNYGGIKWLTGRLIWAK